MTGRLASLVYLTPRRDVTVEVYTAAYVGSSCTTSAAISARSYCHERKLTVNVNECHTPPEVMLWLCKHTVHEFAAVPETLRYLATVSFVGADSATLYSLRPLR